MSARARKYAPAAAAKRVAMEPDPDDYCEHGIPFGEHCLGCEADVADIAGELLEDEWNKSATGSTPR